MLNKAARQTRELIPDGFAIKTRTEPFELARFSPTKIDKSKSLAVVIPACLLSGNVQVAVISIELSIPIIENKNRSSYQSLIYNLPAETAEIIVTVKGDPNSYFVLKDIQIWQ